MLLLLLLILLLLLRRFSSSVQENLSRGEGDLSDLVAINLERGRERGVPGYTTYRNLPLCGLERVDTFEDLENVTGFDKTDVKNLEKVYDDVGDIDLFTGGESGVIIHVSLFTCKFIAQKCGGDEI